MHCGAVAVSSRVNPRLTRALARGGVTAKRHGRDWGVWRSTDRRRRIIGQLSSAEVGLLWMYGCLDWTDANVQNALRWHPSETGREALLDRLTKKPAHSDGQNALIEDVILNACQSTERWGFCAAIRAFRCDAVTLPVERDAIDEGCHRLAKIADLWPTRDGKFLYDLAIKLETKRHFSVAYNLRPAATVTKAIGILRALVQIYA